MTNTSTILFLVIGLTIIGFIVYILLYYDFNKDIKQNYKNLALKLYNGPLATLLNGSGINNIPNLKIHSTNPAVNNANNCSQVPLFIGDGVLTDTDCKRTCVNDTAKAINVGADETVLYDRVQLRPGAHCTIGPRPECNMKTSIALMTINSVVCQSKFPRLFGGPLGNTIVACNNAIINDPQNVLWDYKNNTRVNTWTTTVIDQDEMLPDGRYRFNCKYNGVDNQGNQYQAHPYDRFHPIRNYCAHLIHNAHPSIKTVWSYDTHSYNCECGDPNETRVRLLRGDDPTSPCSELVSEIVDDIKSRKRLIVPYRCFNMYSPLDEVGTYLPCAGDQFTRNGSRMNKLEIELTENENALIEHPLYADLDDGVEVKKGLKIV